MSSEENKLSFSANGMGVELRTKHGGLGFTTEEFSYYQSLFKVADSHNNGKLTVGSSQLNSLLVRTDIPWTAVEKALTIISKYRHTGEPGDVFFTQWLMLCKLIAFFQETKRTLNEKVFKNLHTTKIKIPFANFNLNHARREFVCGSYYKEFDVTLAEWQFSVSGDDFSNQHVKFKIESSSKLFNKSDVPDNSGSNSGSGGGGGGSVSAHSTDTEEVDTDSQPDDPGSAEGLQAFSVERRYSEFEAFALILQNNYKSVVVPPLPLKNWNFLSNSEYQSNQRAREFQMFLNDLISHPVLKYTYELQAFLESSSLGFKSFVELYAHFDKDGKLDYNRNNSGGVGVNPHFDNVTKLLSDGAAAVTSGASLIVAHAKNMGYLNSVWDSLQKNVPMLGATVGGGVGGGAAVIVGGGAGTGGSDESGEGGGTESVDGGAQATDRTRIYLDEIANAGRKLERLISLEQSYHADISKIGLCCKYMSEFETIPGLAQFLSTTSTSLTAMTKTQLWHLDKQYLEAQIPIVYMGRYGDSYASTQQHRANLQYARAQARREEMAAQQKLEDVRADPYSAAAAMAGATGGGGGNTNGVMSIFPASLFAVVGVADQSNLDVASDSGEEAAAAAATATATAAASSSSSSTSSSSASSSAAAATSSSSDADAEQAVNQAKLNLAAAEDAYERKRSAADRATASLKAESRRLDAAGRQQMMTSVAAFVRSRYEAARSNVHAWEDLKAELDSMI